MQKRQIKEKICPFCGITFYTRAGNKIYHNAGCQAQKKYNVKYKPFGTFTIESKMNFE